MTQYRDAPVHTGGGRAVALLIFTAALRASVCSGVVAIDHPDDDVELISKLFEDRRDDDAAEYLNGNGFVRGVLSADFDLQSVDPEIRERAHISFVQGFAEVRGSD